MEKVRPLTLDELKKLYKPPRNAAREAMQSYSWYERFALATTKHVGSVGFFFLVFAWTAVWIGWNIFAPAEFHFDPYPSFVVWLSCHSF